jgi:hypothetical protein
LRATLEEGVLAKDFPSELYRLIPALYPHFADILHSAKITGAELFALSYIKYRGKKLDGGHLALPVSELKAILVKVGEYGTSSGAAGFITNRLEKRSGLVKGFTLSHQERRDLFASATGYRDAVILTEAGLRKLEEINALVEDLYSQVARGTSPAIRVPLLMAFRRAAKALTERLESLSATKRRAPGPPR